MEIVDATTAAHHFSGILIALRRTNNRAPGIFTGQHHCLDKVRGYGNVIVQHQ
jgi:hypothetical protein